MRTLLAVACLAACSFTPPVQTDGNGDPITISFGQPASNADEKSDALEIEVKLSAPPTEDTISVKVGVAGGNATANEDFRLDTTMVTFAVGETSKLVTVTVLEDNDELEGVETVDLVLSEPVGALLDTNTTHQVTISNVILPRVTFVQPTSTTAEGSPTELALVLDTAATLEATVEVAIVSGTATPAVDLALMATTSVTIPAGMTTVMVPIGEIADDLDEDDEDVVFELQNASPNILVGDAKTRNHLITDDDLAPAVGFAQPTSAQAEDAGTITLDVTLSAPSGKTVTVDFNRDAADSAASADATVTGSPGTLTFAPGEVTKQISVTIDNDVLDEDPEEVIVRLSAEVNASLGTASHTLTINDDDNPPSVQFMLAVSDDREDDNFTFETLVVVLSAPSGRAVTVPFTRGGTLSFPSEYSLTASPIVFQPDTTMQSITIDWNRDNSKEPDETVILTLGTPTNATLGATDVHTFTLIDDD